ncbi:non-hydrolyzing UDP-N-acetylglucosamine 2-epimerase [Isoptericola sp. NPDC056618]|uniref:non-hydrolyzing UDP-N-acetylglucosamine 2-epimerase n=1 Tax=Isoptericola sp. NPDC056618 TaxID=3345878 RepID=UPI0036AA317C
MEQPTPPGTFLHVAGARPNFPKLAPVYDALRRRGARQFVVHTGQHFDDALSGVFFRQLGMPTPDRNLGVSGGSDSEVIARIMLEFEAVARSIDPVCVIVYGDVNSTIAAATVAVKLGIPVAHVEAGLRSRDRSMPEEINRIVTDHLASVHFATSADAVENLAAEGITGEGVELVGNPMIDTLLLSMERFDAEALRRDLRLPHEYATVTVHRPGNVDTDEDAREIVEAVHGVADLVDVVLPVHPRGSARLRSQGLEKHDRVHVVPPLGYLEFMGLVRESRLVVTDSGGVQEETTVLGVPCLTLRANTERPVTITHGSNQLVGRESVVRAATQVLAEERGVSVRPPLWDGAAGERIADSLNRRFQHLSINCAQNR